MLVYRPDAPVTGVPGARPGLAATLQDMMLVRRRKYEITFTGQAGPVVCAEFEDCTVIVGPDTTTLRAQLPDQAALWGLVLRIIGLRLEVVDLHLLRSEA